MHARPFQPPISILLFGSGLCALVYQTVWLREFRLIFGASTAASAAVLGIFMAGLGLGSAILGRRAEATKRPLEFYANLEVLISIAAALTPFLLTLIRMLYTSTGGSSVLGSTGATVVRLLLSTLVLCVPTFLMGGTLPAAARAAETNADEGRRRLAFLYGLNTLGAVAGTTLATFYFIEHLGNRQTLWFACGVNLVVAIIARGLGRKMADAEPAPASAVDGQSSPGVSPRFVMIAAAGVGWAFMLMELVWYRMLGPILGGSTFTFGLILAVALLGIGLGGMLYALLRSNSQPTAMAFAGTCALEAVFIAVPFALGDRLAFLALHLRELSLFGFAGHVLGWSIVTSIIVLPAAIVAGYQFPMLIALLGRGRDGVGKHTGQAYAANTVGAIVGSLAGGFGLLPLLGAIGAWKLVVWGLVALAAAALIVGLRGREPWRWRSVAGGVAAIALLFATGPTAVWRHGGIGAGRAAFDWSDPNAALNGANLIRRDTVWEADGVESSVALSASNGLCFIVNGKADGNSRTDMGTQVMAAMIGSILHPDPKSAMVIGLGTGSTAGWLGAVPSMQRVDVVELEEAILHVADVCSPVNENVLKNPKVKIQIGDAREALLTTPEKYDIIFSEPSNPYRAGIASLFSLEFYEANAARLNPGGYFLQWVQAYDIDAEALHTVFATLNSVFPHVETWYTNGGDLLLVASREPRVIDVAQLRARVASEPYDRALRNTWGVDSAEGFLEHFIIGSPFAEVCKASDAPISTDDRNHLEFGFARGVGRGRIGDWIDQMQELAHERGWDRPAMKNGEIDWEKVEAQRAALRLRPNAPVKTKSKEIAARSALVGDYLAGQFQRAAERWKSAKFEPLNPTETIILATCLIAADQPEAEQFIAKLREIRPRDADALEAQAKARSGQWAEAVALLEKAFESWRTDPWVYERLLGRTLDLTQEIMRSARKPELAERLYHALKEPFAVRMRDSQRRGLVLAAAQESGPNGAQRLADAIESMGPHTVWTKPFLTLRVKNFRQTNHPQLAQAEADLLEYIHKSTQALRDGLKVPQTEKSEEFSARDVAAAAVSNSPVASPDAAKLSEPPATEAAELQ